MEPFNGGLGGHKTKILDYYTMIETSPEQQLLSPGALMRIPIRGSCKICGRPIRGSHRVKSNFICHLRRCHPTTFGEFEILSGRKNTRLVSISSLDEPVGMVATLQQQQQNPLPGDQTHKPPLLQRHSPIGMSDVFNRFSYPMPTAAIEPTQTIKQEATPSSVNLSMPRDVSMSPTSAHAHGRTTEERIQDQQQELLNKALMDFIIGNLLPLEVLESDEFNKLINIVRNIDDCTVPSTEEIKELIEDKALTQKRTIKEKIKLLRHFSLSEELWQSCSDSKMYSTISLHYIRDWTYKHIMLSCKAVSTTEKSYNAMEVFETEFGQFKESPLHQVICSLSQKQSLPGFVDMSPSIISNGVSGERTIYHNCFTSELGNAIVCAVQHCSQTGVMHLINKASKLLHTKEIDWNCDVFAAKEWFQQLKLLEIVKSLNDSQKQKIVQLGFENRLLDQSEVNHLTVVLEILKPFREVLDQFQKAGAVTCTGSLVVPYHRLLIQTIAELRIKYPQHSFLQCVDKHFLKSTEFVEENNEAPTIYTTAAILDPRFKLRWADDKHYELYRAHLMDIAKDLIKQKCEPADPSATSPAFSVFAKILKQPSESSADAAVATEVMRYLREPNIGEERDILNYWEQNESNFPNLSILAAKYLAIPTSFADIKSLHPLDWAISTNSSSLSGKLLENIIELGSNSVTPSDVQSDS